jgi:hypothetical protein
VTDAMQRAFHRIVEALWAPVRARRRGLELLKSNLNARQLDQFNREKLFEVYGGATGRRYRLRRGWSMNIDEIGSGGSVVRTWCFYPKGRLCVGDVLLAQKIALEGFELEALEVGNFQRPNMDAANEVEGLPNCTRS